MIYVDELQRNKEGFQPRMTTTHKEQKAYLLVMTKQNHTPGFLNKGMTSFTDTSTERMRRNGKIISFYCQVFEKLLAFSWNEMFATGLQKPVSAM